MQVTLTKEQIRILEAAVERGEYKDIQHAVDSLIAEVDFPPESEEEIAEIRRRIDDFDAGRSTGIVYKNASEWRDQMMSRLAAKQSVNNQDA